MPSIRRPAAATPHSSAEASRLGEIIADGGDTKIGSCGVLSELIAARASDFR
jgi:hypothetical protein